MSRLSRRKAKNDAAKPASRTAGSRRPVFRGDGRLPLWASGARSEWVNHIFLWSGGPEHSDTVGSRRNASRHDALDRKESDVPHSKATLAAPGRRRRHA